MRLNALGFVAIAAMSVVAGCSQRHGGHIGDIADGGEPGYRVAKVVPVAGEGRWDLIAYDADAKLLYVPRSTHTQIIKPETGEIVADIPDTEGVHGVVIVPEVGRAFLSNGKAGTVTVLDLTSHAVIGTVPAGKGPDAIAYDSFSKRVFCFNAKGNDATIIDPTADPAKANVGTIALDSNPELPATDGKGHLYVNLEDGSEIAVIDTNTMKVTANWKLDGGEEPTGLAIDREHHLLFSGCHNKVMTVVDTETGKTIAKLPIGEGCDGAAFDPEAGVAFASCADGTLTAIRRKNDGTFEVMQTLHTLPGARTLTLDPMTHTLYLPTAEFLPKVEGEKRPAMKAGTFRIVIVKPGMLG